MGLSTAQLNQLFEHLSKQQEAIDATAGVLAQASVAGGTIFIAAFGEMKAVNSVALYSKRPVGCCGRMVACKHCHQPRPRLDTGSG